MIEVTKTHYICSSKVLEYIYKILWTNRRRKAHALVLYSVYGYTFDYLRTVV